jgi:hypothetical protein
MWCRRRGLLSRVLIRDLVGDTEHRAERHRENQRASRDTVQESRTA